MRLANNETNTDTDVVDTETENTDALARLEALQMEADRVKTILAKTQEKSRADLLTQYKRDGKITPGAEDLAAKLMELDEDTFAEFLDAQGKLAAFKSPQDGKENAGKPTIGSGAEIEQQLSETGDANNNLLHNLALKWCKENGKDATKYENYSVALRTVAAENPTLVESNHEAQARL